MIIMNICLYTLDLGVPGSWAHRDTGTPESLVYARLGYARDAPRGVDVPYWRLYVSQGSSGLARDLRSEAKPGQKHTLGARRAPNVSVLP